MLLARKRSENQAVASIVAHWWRFSAYVVRRFQDDLGLQIASALTYTTLLSLVPLLAVFLVILSGFGAFDAMRDEVKGLLLDFFLPSTADQIGDYLNRFLINAQNLTAPGVIGLGITAILTLATIEGTFNRIWRAVTPRTWPLRILSFWAVLTMGPIVLGLSLSVSAEVRNLTDEIGVGSSFISAGRWLLQFVLQWVAFSALYLVVPAVRVKIGHAVVGGAVATLLFTLLRFGFGFFVASAENYRTIYGALAAIPIFLLWLYSFWTLLLIGAHIAAALPERRLLTETGEVADRTTAEKRLQAAVLVLRRLWQAAGHRETIDAGNLDPEPPPAVLADLIRCGLIIELDDGCLVAGCDYARAPIGVLWRALDLATPAPPGEDQPPGLVDLLEAERRFMQKPLASLLEKESLTPTTQIEVTS